MWTQGITWCVLQVERLRGARARERRTGVRALVRYGALEGRSAALAPLAPALGLVSVGREQLACAECGRRRERQRTLGRTRKGVAAPLADAVRVLVRQGAVPRWKAQPQPLTTQPSLPMFLLSSFGSAPTLPPALFALTRRCSRIMRIQASDINSTFIFWHNASLYIWFGYCFQSAVFCGHFVFQSNF